MAATKASATPAVLSVLVRKRKCSPSGKGDTQPMVLISRILPVWQKEVMLQQSFLSLPIWQSQAAGGHHQTPLPVAYSCTAQSCGYPWSPMLLKAVGHALSLPCLKMPSLEPSQALLLKAHSPSLSYGYSPLGEGIGPPPLPQRGFPIGLLACCSRLSDRRRRLPPHGVTVIFLSAIQCPFPFLKSSLMMPHRLVTTATRHPKPRIK